MMKRAIANIVAVATGLYIGALLALTLAQRGRVADIGRTPRHASDEEIDRFLATGMSIDELIERLVARTPNGATL